MNEALYMNSSLAFLTSGTVLMWLAVSHTLFLAIPGLIAATDEWLHTFADIRFKTHIHPGHPRYPHYLSA